MARPEPVRSGPMLAPCAVHGMARGADGLKEGAALAEAGLAQHGGGELRLERLDELALVAGGFAHFAPDLGEFLRERFVAERADLPRVEGGEVGARDAGFARTEVGEQFRRVRGPGDEQTRAQPGGPPE